jgi:hypothetical protein
MKKAKLLGLCFVFAGISVGHAQQSANASGGDASGSSGTASYSVGQVVYTYSTASSGSSNQGVQQPYEIFTTGIDTHEEIQLEMTVFPNPTLSTINLRIDAGAWEDMSLELYNALGQFITADRIVSSNTEVPMQGLAAGKYLLRVMNDQTTLKTFSIIKN